MPRNFGLIGSAERFSSMLGSYTLAPASASGIIALRVVRPRSSLEQVCEVVVFDDERRTEPVKVILDMLGNPFTRPLGEWPNERKRSLWRNPDVGFASGAVHCLRSVSASGGSGLIGNSGRKTANACDKHAKETTRNIATYFTALPFHHPSPEIVAKSSSRSSQKDQRALALIAASQQFSDSSRPFAVQVRHSGFVGRRTFSALAARSFSAESSGSMSIESAMIDQR
jgi:hypothetical protein